MGPVPRHRPLPSTLNRYPSLAQRPRPMAERSHVRTAKSRGFYIASQSQQGACIIRAKYRTGYDLSILDTANAYDIATV